MTLASLDVYEQLEIPGMEGMYDSTDAPPEILDARAALVRENNTQALMDALYAASGRAARSHPLHSTYTGLAEEFHRRAGQRITSEALASPLLHARAFVEAFAGPRSGAPEAADA